MKEALKSLKANGVEPHSVFEDESPHGTVNVDPDDREAAAGALREAGYEVGSFEELKSNLGALTGEDEDDTEFTRIKFYDPSIK